MRENEAVRSQTLRQFLPADTSWMHDEINRSDLNPKYTTSAGPGPRPEPGSLWGNVIQQCAAPRRYFYCPQTWGL